LGFYDTHTTFLKPSLPTSEKAHVYKITISPGSAHVFNYNFFYISLVMKEGDVTIKRGGCEWRLGMEAGVTEWVEPGSEYEIRNCGSEDFAMFLLVWK